MEEKEIKRDWYHHDNNCGIWYSLKKGVQVCYSDCWEEMFMITCHYSDNTENHYLYNDLEEAMRVYDMMVGIMIA